MSHLDQLPDELLLLIVDYVFPEDVDSFSLSCKRIHAVSYARLKKHHNLRRQYSQLHSWNYDEPRENSCLSGALPGFLYKILEEPSLGHYTKEWEFGRWFSRFHDSKYAFSNLYLARHEAYTHHQMTTFVDAIRSTDVRSLQKLQWIHTLKDGNEDAIIAIILLNTPNLERLAIHQPQRYPDCIANVVRRASKTGLHLKRLKSVTLTSSPLTLLKIFMSLPTVTSFQCRQIGSRQVAEDTSLESVTLRQRSSNIKDLSLEGGSIGHELVSELLGACKSLETFDFNFPGLTHESPLLYQDLVSALALNAQSSLKSVKLCMGIHSNNDLFWYPLTDFSIFENLSLLDVEAAMLVLEETRDSLIDCLPPSLERLNLSYGDEKILEYTRGALAALECPDTARLPRFKELHVSILDQGRAHNIVESLEQERGNLTVDYGVHCYGSEDVFRMVETVDYE